MTPAVARPADSMSTRDGTPASIDKRSHSADWFASRTGMVGTVMVGTVIGQPASKSDTLVAESVDGVVLWE